MRLLVCALLALCAVLATWVALERVPPDPAAFDMARVEAPRASAAFAMGEAAPPHDAHDAHGEGRGADAAASGAASPSAPAAAPRRRDTAQADAAARRAMRLAPDGVQEHVPGSRAHAAAVASVIESADSQETAAPLARLYFAYFERVPDLEGLDYYVGERERGTSLREIADEFAGSREFELRYGSLDNAAFVDRLFHNIFGVPPDSVQRGEWASALDSGRVTRGEVMLAFSEGPQFRLATSNEVWVTLAYATALQRPPEAAELARWVAFLDAGNPRQAFINRLVATRAR